MLIADTKTFLPISFSLLSSPQDNKAKYIFLKMKIKSDQRVYMSFSVLFFSTWLESSNPEHGKFSVKGQRVELCGPYILCRNDSTLHFSAKEATDNT